MLREILLVIAKIFCVADGVMVVTALARLLWNTIKNNTEEE